MRSHSRVKMTLLAAASVVAIAATAAVGQGQTASAPTGTAISSAVSLNEVERGRYLTALGDCMPCHTRAGGQTFAGGRPLETPFGTVLSANITPDRDTGIGSWTQAQFYRALHEGIDNDGHHLYPAFPYNYYTRVTRQDSDAIFAYLRSVQPVRYKPNRDQLPFPFNIRALMIVWNSLYLDKGEYKPDATKSAAWNRGAYLVTGLGHCGDCHTPKNSMGAPENSRFLQGDLMSDWFAPDVTSNRRTGVGGWSHADTVEFLKTGRNPHAAAAGEMGEVVAQSTSRASPEDLDAITTYLAGTPQSPSPAVAAPDQQQLREGQAIYEDTCSACHEMRGRGLPRFFPPLQGDANLQQRNPTTSLRFILTGVQSTPTVSRPTPFSMPAYAWKLSDKQVAAVDTYIRNAWGNRAPAVSANQVADLRAKLVTAESQFEKPESAGSLAHPGPQTLAPADTDSRDNGTNRAGRRVPEGALTAGRSGGINGDRGGTSPSGASSTGPG